MHRLVGAQACPASSPQPHNPGTYGCSGDPESVSVSVSENNGSLGHNSLKYER